LECRNFAALLLNFSQCLLAKGKGSEYPVAVNGTPRSQSYRVSLVIWAQCYLPPDTSEHT